MKYDRAWIASRIPHQGSMCLLDAVEDWNESMIVCRASSHCMIDNPLRAAGMLGITIGIEYAAQAMAVHGALLNGDDSPPAVGFLTSVRDVRWERTRLDDVAGDLKVCAERMVGDAVNIIYSFSVHAEGAMLLQGRASVMLKVGNP